MTETIGSLTIEELRTYIKVSKTIRINAPHHSFVTARESLIAIAGATLEQCKWKVERKSNAPGVDINCVNGDVQVKCTDDYNHPTYRLGGKTKWHHAAQKALKVDPKARFVFYCAKIDEAVIGPAQSLIGYHKTSISNETLKSLGYSIFPYTER
jgi:hypothetical protein